MSTRSCKLKPIIDLEPDLWEGEVRWEYEATKMRLWAYGGNQILTGRTDIDWPVVTVWGDELSLTFTLNKANH